MEIDDPRLEPYLYTSKALLYSPKTQQTGHQGLVGLHIVQKTKTLPTWIWMTFEHTFNAADIAQVQRGQLNVPPIGYFFYDANCEHCVINTPPPAGTNPPPTQVVRFPPGDNPLDLAAIDSLNAAFTTALRQLRSDNVLQYYRLIDVQWGQPPGTEITCLTNATMESYIQCGDDTGKRLQAATTAKTVQGCMACHSTTQQATDFDFQLLKSTAGGIHRPSPAPHRRTGRLPVRTPRAGSPRARMRDARARQSCFGRCNHIELETVSHGRVTVCCSRGPVPARGGRPRQDERGGSGRRR